MSAVLEKIEKIIGFERKNLPDGERCGYMSL
jgi:hypothetical protein